MRYGILVNKYINPPLVTKIPASGLISALDGVIPALISWLAFGLGGTGLFGRSLSFSAEFSIDSISR